MANKSELQRLSAYTQRLVPLSRNTPNELQTWDKEMQEEINPLDQTNTNVHSMVTGNNEQIERYPTDECSTSDMDSSQFREFPTEIITWILSYLSNDQQTIHQCSLVTKQFNDVATPLLWKTVVLYDPILSKQFHSGLSTASQQRLATLGYQVRSLTLENTNHDPMTDTSSWHLLLPHLTNLNHFCTSEDLAMNAADLGQVPYYSQQLFSIVLSSPFVDRRFFSGIYNYCPHINNFTWRVQLDQSLAWVALLGPQLKYLNVIPKEPMNTMTRMAIQSFDQLDCLKILHLWPDDMKKILLPPTITRTLCYWPDLTHLEIWIFDIVEESTLIAFLQTHPHLQTLIFSGMMTLTDTTLDTMVEWVPNLTSVCLNSANPSIISPDAIKRLVYGCQQLVSFELYGSGDSLHCHFNGVYDGIYLDEIICISEQGIQQIRQEQEQQQQQ